MNHKPVWYKDAVFYQVYVRAFRDSNGEEYVIRAGPERWYLPWFGDMEVETNLPIGESSDDRDGDTPAQRFSTPLDFPGLTDDQAWAIMVKYARMIDRLLVIASPGSELSTTSTPSRFVSAKISSANAVDRLL